MTTLDPPDSCAIFLAYLDNFSVVSAEGEHALLADLQHSAAVLPLRQSDELGLPPGNTMRDAVQMLVSEWTPWFGVSISSAYRDN